MCEEGYVFIMADSTNTLLENTSVPTLVHKFALPAILSNLVGSLYNIADQIFIGQKLGTVGNAATNIAFPLVLLMVTVYVTIGSSGSSKFSLLQGAGENESAGKAVGNSLMALTISGIILMVVTLIFLQPLMVLFGAKGETLELATAYTICLLLSSDKVFTLLINGSFGLLFKIRHLNFTTNECSFFIHLIGEMQYSVKIQQLCGFQPLSRLCRE